MQGGRREAVLTALGDLCAVLLPHLAREEVEMMPVVASTLTETERFAIEKRDNLDPKSFIELGDEGHWLLDGLDDQGREVLLHTVPAVPRFLLLHMFRRRYQRKVHTLWSGTEAVDVPSLSVTAAERGEPPQ
jgi:hypothetical protein